MQNITDSLLSQLTSNITIPISAYSRKLKVDITFPADEDRTKQSFKAESDINNIMARYQKTGVLDFAAKHAPRYGDVTGLDFQSGMQQISQAKAMFADLPSTLRARFENDPVKFLDFVNDDRNIAEARELGLLKPEQRSPEATATPPAPKAAAASAAPSEPPARGQGEPKTNSPT